MSPISWPAVLSSDYLLASLLPLILFVLSLQIVGRPADLLDIVLGRTRRSSHASPSHFSVQRATASYAQYAKLARAELGAMRASYQRMSWAHRRTGYALGYPRKLARLEESIATNAVVADAIARLAPEEFDAEEEERGLFAPGSGIKGDLGRVRESLKHFVRDWSEEGRAERDVIFGPVLGVLRACPKEGRGGKRVLVPGAGLGRLAWEISELGYQTTANEFSFFMNLALRFLLSPSETQRPNQHVLQPYASWFSHQRTTDTLFRKVSFPDVIPRLSDNFALAERDFLSLRAPDGTPAPGYDIVVTLFFIDTSLNAIETLEHIYSLLRPGGRWINLGPLLWTSGGQASIELSLEEVLKLAEAIGFDFAGAGGEAAELGLMRRRTVECEYTADQTAMMKWLYQAEFWVAAKKT